MIDAAIGAARSPSGRGRNGTRTSSVDLRMLRGSTNVIRSFITAVAVAVLVASSAKAGSIAQQKADAQRIRKLAFTTDVKTETIDRSVLPKYLHAQLESSLPYSFDDYARILSALELIDTPAAASEPRLLDLLQQQVLAFYDPLTHVYYAINQLPEGLPPEAKALPLDDAVAVHEFTHALQDQHFAIGKTDFALRNDWDASLALHAVLEGDATLVMMAKLASAGGMTLDDLVSNDMIVNALGTAAAMMRADNGSTPRYFVDELAFPYVQGLRFVIEAYRRGGWDAVNRIYSDPPRSTRDVIHPDEYFAGKRTANAFTTQPPFKVARLLTVEHLGEYHWAFLLGAANANGWTGDRVTLVDDEFCRPTVLIETRWESPEKAAAFRSAYEAFLAKEKADASFVTHGNAVNVAYGADPVLIERFLTR